MLNGEAKMDYIDPQNIFQITSSDSINNKKRIEDQVTASSKPKSILGFLSLGKQAEARMVKK